ncbi:hypothetical protein CHS0354_012529 [Potamilus streckersoni]|uniref:SH3 domain-containing protein n=1 Tax=Potamilus streckersoni TaxID=2493646 RepID=A0AAE0SWJ3_9BIVA|nr:hypothetical protein CHS0354_012529 [Potamilus streckersoni]
MSSEKSIESFEQKQQSIGEPDRMHPISSTNKEDIDEIVYALSSFKGVGQHQLSFGKGATIRILEKPDDNWWWGEINGVQGYIPVNHLTYESVQQMYWEDNEYFGNYGKLKIHHEMLSDQPRTLAYQSAIQKNAQQLRGKRVIDVGCGTGILSLMCAKYGQPSKVI